MPYRLIQLYTYEGEVVLDPFIGSGTTAVAAIKARRHFVGYDIEPTYVEMARQRVAQASRLLPLPIFSSGRRPPTP